MSTVGRDRELAVLFDTVGETAAGAGGCLQLTGPAGIGKSHLLGAAMEQSRVRCVAVAHRAAFALDRAAPWLTLASTLQRCRPRTDAFGWLQTESDNAYRTLTRLAETLQDYVTTRPLLIVVDDAHWMDELSAMAIRELVPALAASPVRWLFAHRPAPADTPGQRLLAELRDNGADRLTLGVLTEPAVARLCAESVGAEVDNTVLALANGCGGVPLHVERLMTALRMTRQLVVTDGVATVVGDRLPSSFVTIVEQILRGLSDGTQRLLRTGSVFGRPFRLHTLARLLNRPALDLVPLIEEATAATVLVDEGGALAFDHDLVRQAIYGMLSTSVAAALHREAAAVIRTDGGSPLEVAEHLLKADEAGTPEAIDLLRQAAGEVAGQAPSTAADLILRALRLLGEHDAGRSALIADAVGLLASASRLTEAHDLGEAAFRAGLDAATAATLRLGLAEASKHAGQNQLAIEYADRGLTGDQIPDSTRAKLYAIRAHAQVYTGRLAAAEESAARADALGQATGEFGASVFGLTARSLVAQAEGRLTDALSHAQQATEAADRVGGEAAHRHPRIWLGSALTNLDRLDAAEVTLREGRRESERLGTAWSTPLWHYYYANLLAGRGQLDEAAAEADAGAITAEQLTAYQLAVPLLGTLIRLDVARGELARADEHLSHLRRLTSTGITATPEDITWAEALLIEATDGPAAALDLLRDVYPTLPARPALIVLDPTAAAMLVRIAVRAAAPASAELAVQAARHLADRNPTVGSLAAAAAHAEGLLRRDPGQLATAVELFRQTPRRAALASALEDAAVIGPARDRAAATASLNEALAIATGCGARRAQLRLERRLGTRRRPAAGQPARRLAGLEPLSPAEYRVALLVAKGHTNYQVGNRLQISSHTVDSHLRNIFRKLAIRSRIELANLVGRANGPNPPNS